MLRKKHEDKYFLYGIVLILIFYGVLHCFTKNDLLDDRNLAMLSKGTSFFGYLKMRYSLWTSRVFLEAAFVAVSKLPFLIWKALDTFAFVIIYWGIHKTLNLKGYADIIAAMALGSYIFLQMASAGWKITSIIYIWTFASAEVCFVILKRSFDGKRQSVLEYVFYIICMLFTCNYEIMAGIMLFVYSALGIWRFNEKNKKYIYSGIVLQISSLLFIFLNPGNRLRMASEIALSNEYSQISFWDKCRIGLVSTFEHFVSIPNVLYGMLCLLLAILLLKKSKNITQKVIGFLPLAIDIALSLYYVIKDILLGGKRNYVFDEPAMLPPNTGEWVRQLLLIALFLISAIAIIYSLYHIFEDKNAFYLSVLILAAGFASRFAMSFSPSVYASGTRTFTQMYLSFVWIIAMLAPELKDKGIKIIATAVLALGMLTNTVLTVIPFLQNYK